MPTEHEYKYVISQGICSVFTEEISRIPHKFLEIRQGYLAFSKGMTTRIREVVEDGKKQQWYLTFKQKVNNRVIEIEKKIDKRDGADLWQVCVGKLKKERYVFDNKGVTWELDFFRKGHHLYFIQMEVELAEGKPKPTKLPDFVAPFVIFEVPLDDDRFSNKRLGDVEYTTALYQELQEEHKHDRSNN